MILWTAAELFTVSLRQPKGKPFRSPMNNYWMTNNVAAANRWPLRGLA